MHFIKTSSEFGKLLDTWEKGGKALPWTLQGLGAKEQGVGVSLGERNRFSEK